MARLKSTEHRACHLGEEGRRGEEGKVGGQKEVLPGPLRLSTLSLESLEDCSSWDGMSCMPLE